MKPLTKDKRVTFENAEPGEIIYMYGDPSKCFVVDTKLEATIFMHEKGHDPIVSRVVLVKPEFEGRWTREPRGFTKFAVAEDDPIPRIDEQQFSRVLLKRIKQTAQMCLGGHILEQMDLRAIRDHMTDSIIFSLRTNVMSEQLSERSKTITFKYPASWWEQLKQSHAPRWFLKKYPVKKHKTSQKVTFEEIALYPNLPSIMPDRAGEAYFQGMWHTDLREKETSDEFVEVAIS